MNRYIATARITFAATFAATHFAWTLVQRLVDNESVAEAFNETIGEDFTTTRITFAATDRKDATDFAWTLAQRLIDNENIIEAFIETIDEDFDEPDPDDGPPWSYNNYPGHPV